MTGDRPNVERGSAPTPNPADRPNVERGSAPTPNPTDYTKPLPEISAESKPFWDACARHELLVQTCRACGSVQYYPRGVCATCWSPDVAWTPSSGRGRVYTFTVTHRTQARGFRDDLPYVLAWIELEEGVQVMSNIVGVDPVKVAIGMQVKVTFEDVKDGLSIPKFTGR